MALLDNVLDAARRFARAFVPEGRRVDFEKRLLRAGVRRDPYTPMGLYFFSVLVAMLVAYFGFVLRPLTGWALQYSRVEQILYLAGGSILFVSGFLFVVLAASWYVGQYFLSSKTFQRTKEVEGVLEEYLRYVTENLRGGMPFQQALWNSVKPEFGVLAEEIEIVTKKVITGTELEVALDEFTEKYDSPMLQRTFDIIAEALAGGGRITDTLDDIVKNLSSLKELKQEMVATNMSYTIFINAIVIFITPLLFALSTQFIFILNRIGETVGQSLESASSGGSFGGFGAMSFSGASLSLSQFRMFAISILIINSLGAVILTTIMNKGDIRQVNVLNAITYPAVSAGIYILIANAATNLFAGFVPI